MRQSLSIILVLFFWGGNFVPCIAQSILLSNTSTADFNQRVIELSWKELVRKYNISDTTYFSLQDQDGTEIPIQFEYLANGSVSKVLALVSVPAKGTTTLLMVKRKRTAYPSLVYGRYVPERKDDFAWENNKIAFRMYGRALQFTNENAHGIDVWAKRTSRLVINDWYKTGDYHIDHGEGLDFYSVGSTMGAGNIAPYFADTVFYPGNYTQWKIMEQGPLRLRFKLSYDSFMYRGVRVAFEKEIELRAGDHFNKITVSLNASSPVSVPMAVGVVTRKENGIFFFDKNAGLATYWEPAHPSHGTIGVGVVFSEKIKKVSARSQQLFITKITNGRKFVYYAGATWDQQGDHRSALEWTKATKYFSTDRPPYSSIKIIYRIKKKGVNHTLNN